MKKYSATPNKEAVRRISLLNGSNYCYMLMEPDNLSIQVLANINTTKLDGYQKELEEWCGMKFLVFNENSPESQVKNIKTYGEKILPIEF